MPRDDPKVIDVVRARAKELELRDSATMIFTDQALIQDILPRDTVESIVSQDKDGYKLSIAKSADP